MVLLVRTKYRVNRRYSQKTIFNMASVCHFEFQFKKIYQHVTVLGIKI